MEAHRGRTELVWSPFQASEVMGVPMRTLEAWRWRRIGPPYVKLGKRVGYRPEDIREWLARQTVNTDSGSPS